MRSTNKSTLHDSHDNKAYLNECHENLHKTFFKVQFKNDRSSVNEMNNTCKELKNYTNHKSDLRFNVYLMI